MLVEGYVVYYIGIHWLTTHKYGGIPYGRIILVNLEVEFLYILDRYIVRA